MPYAYTTHLTQSTMWEELINKGETKYQIHYSATSTIQAKTSLLVINAFCLFIILQSSFIVLIKLFLNN